MSESLKPTSLTELRKARAGTIAVGPSGAVYKVRALNIEAHALAGNLPAHLREMAMKGSEEIDKALSASDADMLEHGQEIRGYLDSLVRLVIVEPDLARVEDLDEVVHPADYRWAVNIAMGEEQYDGQGRLLWGKPPVTVWETFRQEHGCDEDCPGCGRVQRALAAASGGRAD